MSHVGAPPALAAACGVAFLRDALAPFALNIDLRRGRPPPSSHPIVLHRSDGRVYVRNLRQVPATTLQEAVEVLKEGARNKVVSVRNGAPG